ncbi:MAG: arylesterase [Gammaproteobacteria bacterium]|nr:arylesterase [Gammaproteobacteria bacterium]
MRFPVSRRACTSAYLFRRLAAGLVVALCLAMPLAAPGDGGRAILVFGDSLSTAYGFEIEKSWVSLLEKRLEERGFGYRVVNASISGETTRGGRARIEDAVAATDPRIVIVELGGNDGLRGIDLNSTRENLKAIVDAALNSGAEVLLLAMKLPPNYGPAYTERFQQIYTEIAELSDVRLVPFFLEGVAGNSTLMQADDIHPEAEAQPILLDNIWPYLEPLLAR